MLVAKANDVKIVHHLMRQANSQITLELYTGAIDEKTRKAQRQVVQQMTTGSSGSTGMTANA